jgi:hypothetical protein
MADDEFVDAVAARNAQLLRKVERLHAAADTIIDGGDADALAEGLRALLDVIAEEITRNLGQGAAMYLTDSAFRAWVEDV